MLESPPAGSPCAPLSPVRSGRSRSPRQIRPRCHNLTQDSSVDLPSNDPICELLLILHDTRSQVDFNSLMYAGTGLMDGFQDFLSATETIERVLDEISRDPRDHLQIGDDSCYCLSTCLPKPWYECLRTISKSQGWAIEALFQGLLVNTGWLEATDTRLGIRKGSHCPRPPGVPSFTSMSSSSRTSSLHKFIVRQSVDVTHASPEIRRGLCQVSEATIAGHRMNLELYQRSGLAADEASTCYKTMHRAEDTAAASVSRSTMCALVSCERDGVVSGQQAVQRESYGFFHLVWGQHESIWDIMLPRYDGFAKLFHYVAVVRKPSCSPKQDSTASMKLWLDYHNWMC